MRAQVLEEFNKPYVFKDNIPNPSDPLGQDVLIKVEAASYCHTDAVFATGTMQWTDLPRIGSHEFAGQIVALGSDVPPQLRLKIGQRVGVPGRAFHPCGECYECRNNDGDPAGYGVWCKNAGNLGLSRDGGFQEFCIADSRQVAPMPDAISSIDVAPLMCAGLTVWNALQKAGIEMKPGSKGNAGKTIAISGAGGGLGHLGVQFAAKLGCSVIAIEAADKQKDLLLKVIKNLDEDGSRVTMVDARNEDAMEVRANVAAASRARNIRGADNELGCDALIVLPESQKAVDYGMKLLKDHSICVVVSFPIDGFRFNPRDIIFRHIEITGVLVGRNQQLRAMLEFAASQGVRALSKIYRLEDLNKLVAEYNKNEGGKLVIDIDKK